MTGDRISLMEFLLQQLGDLKNLQFSYRNPLFWLGLAILFLILLRFWMARKAFSFTVVIGSVLLATTKIEEIAKSYIISSGMSFDPFLIRIFSFFLIAVVFLYYALVREY